MNYYIYAVNRLLGKVAVIVPAQVGEFVCKAVVVSSYRMGLGIWGVGVGVGSSCVVLQFTTQATGGGGCMVCIS